MKKLIIIIFMFSFWANAQENWQFKADKGKHVGVGAVLAVPSLLLMYNVTNDWKMSVNASFLIPAFVGLGKEFLDGARLLLTGQGAGFSFADFSYTVGGALITTFTVIIIHRWKQRKWRYD